MNLGICGERVTGKLEHIQNSKGERSVSFKVSAPDLLGLAPIGTVLSIPRGNWSPRVEPSHGTQHISEAQELLGSLKAGSRSFAERSSVLSVKVSDREKVCGLWAEICFMEK